MRFIALAIALVVALPAAATAQIYKGTGGSAPGFTIELDRHGRSLGYQILYQAPCDVAGVQENREWSGGFNPRGQPPLRVDRHGHFKQQVRGLDTGLSVVDVDFAGRVGRHGARGIFDITLRSKQIATTCTTGLVHWTAQAS